MKKKIFTRGVLFICTTLMVAGVPLLPSPIAVQEEVFSAIRRYKDREISTGYYEEYEVKPRRQSPFVEIPGVTRGIFSYSPAAPTVRIRSRLADSHQGIKFYQNRRSLIAGDTGKSLITGQCSGA